MKQTSARNYFVNSALVEEEYREEGYDVLYGILTVLDNGMESLQLVDPDLVGEESDDGVFGEILGQPGTFMREKEVGDEDIDGFTLYSDNTEHENPSLGFGEYVTANGVAVAAILNPDGGFGGRPVVSLIDCTVDEAEQLAFDNNILINDDRFDDPVRFASDDTVAAFTDEDWSNFEQAVGLV